jgi:cell division transport system permease protein
MTVASVVVVTLTLTLLGIALIVRDGAHRTEQGYLNQLNVSVFFQPDCGTPTAPANNCLTPADIQNVQQTLQHLPQVKSIQFVSHSQADQIFRQEFANEPALIHNTNPSALPESFIVKLKNAHQYAVIRSAVGLAPGVEQVNDASSTLHKLFSVFNHVASLVLIFAAALLAATVLLIYNAMRLAAFTRRKEIGIMRLVGASDLFVQAPFVVEGTIIGIIGGFLATVMLILSKLLLRDVLDVAILHELGTWSTLASVLPVIWIVALVLPSLAAYLTVQRYVRV